MKEFSNKNEIYCACFFIGKRECLKYVHTAQHLETVSQTRLRMRYVISKGQVLRAVNSLGENHFPKVLLAAQATPSAFLSAACTRKGTFYFIFLSQLFVCSEARIRKRRTVRKGLDRKGRGTVRKWRGTVTKG